MDGIKIDRKEMGRGFQFLGYGLIVLGALAQIIAWNLNTAIPTESFAGYGSATGAVVNLQLLQRQEMVNFAGIGIMISGIISLIGGHIMWILANLCAVEETKSPD